MFQGMGPRLVPLRAYYCGRFSQDHFAPYPYTLSLPLGATLSTASRSRQNRRSQDGRRGSAEADAQELDDPEEDEESGTGALEPLPPREKRIALETKFAPDGVGRSSRQAITKDLIAEVVLARNLPALPSLMEAVHRTRNRNHEFPLEIPDGFRVGQG